MARAVAWVSRFFLGVLGVKIDRMPDADEHADVLRGAIELHGHGQSDEAAPAEKAMLRSVLDLGDRTVADVMTHRGTVVLIDAGQPMDSIVNQMLEAPIRGFPSIAARSTISWAWSTPRTCSVPSRRQADRRR